jgi:hypothetical protein
MEDGRLDYAQVLGHTRTETSKSLQLQVRSSLTTGDDTQASTAFGDCFIGPWCLIAPPADPDRDDQGNVKTACEAMVLEMGDELTVLGTRDVRSAKWAGDIKAGEFALFNKFGSRLAMREKTVSILAGGGHLTFNIEKKTISLVGIPGSPGGGAPNLVLSTDSIGLVSETGGASVNVSGKTFTVSGGSASIDTGTVNLGVGATDPVVSLTYMQTYIAQLYAYLNLIYASIASMLPPPPVPLALPPPPTLATLVLGSMSVKVRL